MINDKKEKNDKAVLAEVAIEGAATETVQRYGSAAKEHLTAYSGIDNEKSGKNKSLKRGLKRIAKSKVSPNYKKTNLKQQAGFAAEEKYRARQNAEKIINGESTRYTRTDDIGYPNDPLRDHVLLDSEGVEILGTGEQMKFVGNSPKACLDLFVHADKYQKYIDADVKITVPSDYYEGILAEADKEIEKLERQLESAESTSNKELTAEKQAKINKLKKIKANLRNSGISNKEALFARTHPKLSTAIDIGKLANRAGIEQAKYGAAIAGSLSLVSNTVAVIKGQKQVDDAATEVALTTGKGAVLSYATAFSGSIVKSSMQNSGSQMVRTMSRTNIASTMVTTTLETGKTIHKYIRGDINGLECLEELGQKGVNQISAAMFATAGQALIPIPVVGAMVGSMVGYALSNACYKELTNALREEKLAKEERIRIEAECAEAIRMIRQYRIEMNEYVDRYLTEHIQVFNNAFEQMNEAIGKDGLIDDIEGFIGANNQIRQILGYQPVITSLGDLDDEQHIFKL
jgi:hypothetical protein